MNFYCTYLKQEKFVCASQICLQILFLCDFFFTYIYGLKHICVCIENAFMYRIIYIYTPRQIHLWVLFRAFILLCVHLSITSLFWLHRTHKSKYIDWMRHGTTYCHFHESQYVFIITNIHWHIKLTWGNQSSWGAWLFLAWSAADGPKYFNSESKMI